MGRDHHLCVKCGAVAEEVHHIIHLTEENINDQTITLNPENLQCLCKQCHFNEHKEDKYNGLLKSKGITEYEYTFNAEGMLIRKEKAQS